MDEKSEGAGGELSFEAALKRVEEIVEQLEGGDWPLERALELFEEGVRLARMCARKLEEMERRIDLLIETEDGSVLLRPAPAGEGEDG